MAAHRRWRINATASNSSLVSMSMVAFATTAGGTDIAPTGTASSPASWNAGSNPPGYANDGNAGTWWASSSLPGFLQVDFGVGVTVDVVEVRITSRGDGWPDQAPTTFLLECSDDAPGVVWTAAGLWHPSVWSVGQTQTFTVDPAWVYPPTYARASQQIVAALSVPAAYVRVTQASLAAMVKPAASVHASTVQIDVMLGIASGVAARATWLVIDALVWIHEVTMPNTFPVLPGLSYSVIKRPKFFTGTGTSASGREVRVGYAVYPLWEWDLTFDYLPDKATPSAATPSDLKQLLGFFLSQQGALMGFYFRDPDDSTVSGQIIAIGNGVLSNFTIVRTFGGSDGSGTEPIGAVDLSVPFHVYLNGGLQDPSQYDIVTQSPVNQVIRFHIPPPDGVVISADLGFFYYCRFKDDSYDFEKFMDKFWSQRLVTLASLRG